MNDSSRLERTHAQKDPSESHWYDDDDFILSDQTSTDGLRRNKGTSKSWGNISGTCFKFSSPYSGSTSELEDRKKWISMSDDAKFHVNRMWSKKSTKVDGKRKDLFCCPDTGDDQETISAPGKEQWMKLKENGLGWCPKVFFPLLATKEEVDFIIRSTFPRLENVKNYLLCCRPRGSPTILHQQVVGSCDGETLYKLPNSIFIVPLDLKLFVR